MGKKTMCSRSLEEQLMVCMCLDKRVRELAIFKRYIQGIDILKSLERAENIIYFIQAFGLDMGYDFVLHWRVYSSSVHENFTEYKECQEEADHMATSVRVMGKAKRVLNRLQNFLDGLDICSDIDRTLRLLGLLHIYHSLDWDYGKGEEAIFAVIKKHIPTFNNDAEFEKAWGYLVKHNLVLADDWSKTKRSKEVED